MTPKLMHNLDAEACVIGAILVDSDAYPRARELVSASDFCDRHHQKVFEAIEGLAAEGRIVDPVLVKARLVGEMEDPADLIFDLMDRVPTALEVERHARLVLDLSVQRRALELCREVTDQLGDRAFDGSDAIKELTQGLYDLAAQAQRGPQRADIGRTITQVMENATSPNKATLQTTGFDPIDKLLRGFVRSSLVTIAARPGHGKTTFALDCFRNFVLAGGKAGYISLEMPADQVVSIVLAAEAQIDHARYSGGGLTARELDQNLMACERIYPHRDRMIIETPRDHQFHAVTASLRRMIDEGCKIVFVDYLQLIRYSKAENRRLEVSHITGALKALALETGAIIVQLAQLNREVESSAGRKPRMSDLKESGSIEEDSDYCIFPHVVDESETEALVDLLCLKNRHGPTGDIGLNWHKAHRRYRVVQHWESAVNNFGARSSGGAA